MLVGYFCVVTPGRMLGELIHRTPEINRHVSQGGKISILAHSMGGLVARSFIEEHGQCYTVPLDGPTTQYDTTLQEWPGKRISVRSGGNIVDRLITLGTPHHGSPAAGTEWVDFANITEWWTIKERKTPGALDLMWDDFDGAVSANASDIATGNNPYWFPERYNASDVLKDANEAFNRHYMALIDPSFNKDSILDQYIPSQMQPITYSHPNPWLANLNSGMKENSSGVDYIFYAGGLAPGSSDGDTLENGVMFLAFELLALNAKYWLSEGAVPTRSALGEESATWANDEANTASVLIAHPWNDPFKEGETLSQGKIVNYRFFLDYNHDQLRGGSGAQSPASGFTANDYNDSWKNRTISMNALYSDLGYGSLDSASFSLIPELLYNEPLFLKIADDLVDNSWEKNVTNHPNMVFIPPGTFTFGDQYGIGDPDDFLPSEFTIPVGYHMMRHELTAGQLNHLLNWALDPNGDGDRSDSYLTTWRFSPTPGNWIWSASLVAQDPRDPDIKWLTAEVIGPDGRTHPITFDGSTFSVAPTRLHDSARANFGDKGENGQVIAFLFSLFHGYDNPPYSPVDGSVDKSKEGFRLPSEEEWEWAARGGWRLAKYPWWTSDEATHTEPTVPNLALPNGYGLFDMAGGQVEWCDSGWHRGGFSGDKLNITNNDFRCASRDKQWYYPEYHQHGLRFIITPPLPEANN